jgi:hypothetical protein
MRLSAPGFLLACAFATVAALGVRAQDGHYGQGQDGHYGQGHAENHDWYKDLKQPQTGYSCCNGRSSNSDGDCRPTRAYLNDDGMWYALLDGRWVPVPPKVVLKQLAPDGSSHICASKSGMIYCFLGGSPKI